MLKNIFIHNSRIWSLFSLALITPLGFALKYYHGPAAHWVNNSLGGVFYEIFWCLVLFILLPRLAPWKIAVSVFGVTCLLEWMQLWHAPLLETIRCTCLGAAILGTTFVWSDFGYYLLGSAIGWQYLKLLTHITH
jgi:hypothetical protein